MSTITSVTSAASAATASANAQLQEAAQSVISGSTGNSSMDVNSLVTALVSAKTAGQTATLSAELTSDQTQLSAVGALSAALSGLQAALGPLTSGALQSSFKVTTSGTGLAATAGSGSVAGAYTVDVSQIAQAQSITSGAFSTSAAANMGTGTLALSLGGQTMSVQISSNNSSLTGIAAAINSASGNPGITATVVTGSDGQHLVLSSAQTGAANVIGVTVTPDSPTSALADLGVQSKAGTDSSSYTFQQGITTTDGQSSLVPSSTTPNVMTGSWTQTTAAQDAEFSINGTAATSSTNSVTSVLPGVTLSLSATATGSSQTLNVAADTSAQETDIENFVTAYNTLVTTMSSLTSFDSSTSTAGPLLGDSMLNTIRNTLGALIGSGVSSGGTTTSLGSIGITLNTDGSLAVDSTKLDTAVQSNPAGISALFTASGSIAAQLNSNITSFTQTGGIIDTRTNAINADITNIQDQQTQLTAYAALLTTQYNNQFTALNTLMTQMNSNSQYLTQLFGGSNSAGSLATNKS